MWLLSGILLGAPIGFLLDSHWASTGFLLGSYWLLFGSLLVSYWVLIGFLLDSFGIPNWLLFGSSLDFYWIPVGSLCTPHVLSFHVLLVGVPIGPNCSGYVFVPSGSQQASPSGIYALGLSLLCLFRCLCLSLCLCLCRWR